MRKAVPVALVTTLTWAVPAFAAEDAPLAADRAELVRRGEEPSKRHRIAIVGAGLLAVGGAAFGYWGQGEARRAGTIADARESQRVLGRARTATSTANWMYGLAAASAVYGLVLEFLPSKQAETASLTFHF